MLTTSIFKLPHVHVYFRLHLHHSLKMLYELKTDFKWQETQQHSCANSSVWMPFSFHKGGARKLSNTSSMPSVRLRSEREEPEVAQPLSLRQHHTCKHHQSSWGRALLREKAPVEEWK